MEAPHRAPVAGETPPPAAAEGSSEESRWLESLSDPELDLLISLKMLAVKRAETAGRPHLADAFDLRTLRALGVALLESFKEQQKETAVDPTVLDRLALSRDPDDADASFRVSSSSSDSEVFRRHSKDHPKPNSVKKKRKQIYQDGYGAFVYDAGATKRLSQLAREERVAGDSSEQIAMISLLLVILCKHPWLLLSKITGVAAAGVNFAQVVAVYLQFFLVRSNEK